MRYFASAKYQEKRRAKARKHREKRGEQAVVHYFHQVDDPYSHLAVQKLDQLKAHYNLPFQPHLVSKPEAAYLGSSAHFDKRALDDVTSVAGDYATLFAPSIDLPGPEGIDQANQALALDLNEERFAQTAITVGTALWANRPIEIPGGTHASATAVLEGNELRQTLGHYQGAMFYFDGEWFWGIDRIRLLEARLIEEGFANGEDGICVPEPTPVDTTNLNASHILLEYFPSLRSPYTAFGHQRVLDLIARSGVDVEVRPVMPMLMRGIPAPRPKQRYIITDAGREARAHGVPLGRIVDPFGEPVKRAFALFPGAAALGRGLDFVTAYLLAAWYEGVDITTEKGLRQVAANAEIDWDALQHASENNDWEALLDENLNTMMQANLWGVPSFRVSGGSGENKKSAYACWGQDRIWRVENEIASRV
jgi:2-hydroxychromene-2-carboxylate isomerase